MFTRDNTRCVKVGKISIGGSNKVVIQSMLNTDPHSLEACLAQSKELEECGCELIRATVPDIEAAKVFGQLKSKLNLPLVADIHFDYRLALAAIKEGADKIRINPGNIGIGHIEEIVQLAKEYKVPIRVGVNSGSLEKDILKKYGVVNAKALYESAARNVKYLEELDFKNMVVSIKASNPIMCLDAYRLFAQNYDYPLHIGVTEAGTILSGSIKSAVGLSLILHEGIGDTMRVSLSGNPTNEIKTAKLILQALGLKNDEIEVISCPTCGRTNIDIEYLANKVEDLARFYKLGIKIAVMGCVVNGPGEAREADLGIAGGKGEGLIIKKGQIIKKVPEHKLLEELEKELINW